MHQTKIIWYKTNTKFHKISCRTSSAMSTFNHTTSPTTNTATKETNSPVLRPNSVLRPCRLWRSNTSNRLNSTHHTIITALLITNTCHTIIITNNSNNNSP